MSKYENLPLGWTITESAISSNIPSRGVITQWYKDREKAFKADDKKKTGIANLREKFAIFKSEVKAISKNKYGGILSLFFNLYATFLFFLFLFFLFSFNLIITLYQFSQKLRRKE